MKPFYMYDNDILKWKHDGQEHCLHVMRDNDAVSPREAGGLYTIMACWHNHYRLGDTIPDRTPEEFWQRMVRETVPEEDILKAAEEGKLPGIRVEKVAGKENLVNIFELYEWQTVVGSTDPKEYLEYEEVARDTAADYLLDDLTVKHCMTLMEPYAEWMPLWLYDHSGITISCGARTGQFADRWDSMQVGWILLSKDVALKEYQEYVLDENGERIREEYKREGYPSTWRYKTRALTEETWRNLAVEIMKSEVTAYDYFLRDEVYGYKLLYKDPDSEDEWEEEDSCWGFFGADIIESGMADDIGYGLSEAIDHGEYQEGEVERYVRETWAYNF